MVILVLFFFSDSFFGSVDFLEYDRGNGFISRNLLFLPGSQGGISLLKFFFGGEGCGYWKGEPEF